MNIVGAVSGAVLGYIGNNIPGAIKGAKIGFSLSQKDFNNDPSMPPYNRKYVKDNGYSGKRKNPNTMLRSKGGSTYRRGRRSAYKSSVHKMILRDLPTKHYENSVAATAMTHNTVYTCSPSTGIVQGTSTTTRLGDSVQLVGLKIRGTIQTDTASKGYAYRMIVGWSGEEYNNAITFASGLGASEIFYTNSVANWVPNGIINPKAFTVLSDMAVTLNSQIAGAADLESFNFTVPLNSKFNYQGPASVYGKFKNLYIVLIASVVGGVPATTNAGTAVIAYDLMFK